MTQFKPFFIVIGLATLALFSKFLPIADNFSAVGSVALFTGCFVNLKYLKYIIPISLLYVSDLFINNTILRPFFPDVDGIVFFNSYMIWVYLSFIIAIIIGSKLRKNLNIFNTVFAVLGFTAVFFIVTNLGTFINSPLYPRNIAGLIACFTAAIPFIKASLVSNFIFSTVLFSSYAIINSSQLELITDRIK